MTHNWRWYEMAQRIAEQLLEAKLINEKDMLKVREIIQIVLEEES